MCSPGSAWTRRICSLVRRHSGTGSDAKCTRGVRADLVVSAAFASSFDALCADSLRADDVDRSSEPLDEADFDAGLSAGLSSVGHTFGLGASDGVIAESHGVEGDDAKRFRMVGDVGDFSNLRANAPARHNLRSAHAALATTCHGSARSIGSSETSALLAKA